MSKPTDLVTGESCTPVGHGQMPGNSSAPRRDMKHEHAPKTPAPFPAGEPARSLAPRVRGGHSKANSRRRWTLLGSALLAISTVGYLAVGEPLPGTRSDESVREAFAAGTVAGDERILPVEVMAVEWAKDNIQVNGIVPGFIRTPLTEQALWGTPHRAECDIRRPKAPDGKQDVCVCQPRVGKRALLIDFQRVFKESNARGQIADGPSIPEISPGEARSLRVRREAVRG